jgi:hypothetical protein
MIPLILIQEHSLLKLSKEVGIAGFPRNFKYIACFRGAAKQHASILSVPSWRGVLAKSAL